MGQPLTTDNIGEYFSTAFANTFKEAVLPGLDTMANDINTLKTGMENVEKRLSGVEDRLGDVEKNMATNDDLKNLENRLNTRLKAINDVQSNLTERVETLESPMVFA